MENSKAGHTVKFQGLKAASHLNGTRGTLVKFLPQEQRWKVRCDIDNNVVNVKPPNVVRIKIRSPSTKKTTKAVKATIQQPLDVVGMLCHHGSTPENFVSCKNNNNSFHKVIDDYITDSANASLYSTTEEEHLALREKFGNKHTKSLRDPEFSKFIFAYCTHIYLGTLQAPIRAHDYDECVKGYITTILDIGLQTKYEYDVARYSRYHRDVQTDRGIIKCLARETSEFCGCMQQKQEEAKLMEKVGYCFGCKQDFPKKRVKNCSGCRQVQYCSVKCAKDNWPKHKKCCPSR